TKVASDDVESSCTHHSPVRGRGKALTARPGVVHRARFQSWCRSMGSGSIVTPDGTGSVIDEVMISSRLRLQSKPDLVLGRRLGSTARFHAFAEASAPTRPPTTRLRHAD